MIDPRINKNAVWVLKQLENAGHQAGIVGGACRDMVRDLKPKDWDIATSATPEQIKDIFGSAFGVGEAFGVVMVRHNDEIFEVATFRQDIGGDGRHPDKVELVREVEIDLSRRDFTMNAIFMTADGIVRDPFAGALDIADHIIEFVGDANERIAEDKLRVLRAFRFMSQLSFTFGENTMTAIKVFDGDFTGVSQERITAEFSKIVTGPNAFETLKLMAELFLLDIIVPEIADTRIPHNNRYHTEKMAPFGNSILAHIMFVVKFAAEQCANSPEADRLIVMLSALFHDIGKPICKKEKMDGSSNFLQHDVIGGEMTTEILTRMKFPTEVVKRVSNLVRRHMNLHDIGKVKKLHKLRKMLAMRDLNLGVMVSFADTCGTAAKNGVPNFTDANEFKRIVNMHIETHGTTLPEPLVTGIDLLASGLKAGPDFKKRLETAFNLQLNGETNKSRLVRHAVGLITGE